MRLKDVKTPLNFKNMGSSYTPFKGQIFKQMRKMDKQIGYGLAAPAKKLSSRSLYSVTRFTSDQINKLYIINPENVSKFRDSLMLYFSLISNVNNDPKDLRNLLRKLKQKYEFTQNEENLGCLIGYLTEIRMTTNNNTQRSQTNDIIEKVYLFTTKDRQFCDLSKYLYLKMYDIMEMWLRHVSYFQFLNRQEFSSLAYKFNQFVQFQTERLYPFWKEMAFTQRQIVRTLHKFIDLKACTKYEIKVNLFSVNWLLRMLLSKKSVINEQLSQQFKKTVNDTVMKLCYIHLNKQLYYVSTYLFIFEIVMQNPQFFKETYLQIYLSSIVTVIFFQQIGIQTGKQQICDQLNLYLSSTWAVYDQNGEMSKRIPNLNQYIQLNNDISQRMSYSSSFNQRRSKIDQKIHQSLNSSGQKYSGSVKTVIQTNRDSTKLRRQLLQFAHLKLQKHSYIDLYLNLQIIHLVYSQKIIQINNSVHSRMKKNSIKQVQSIYVACLLKIMKSLTSNTNFLQQHMFMNDDFINICYVELISRFGQLNIEDIDFQFIYSIIYEEYHPAEILTFDIEGPKMGLNQIFRYYKNKSFAEKPGNMYEYEVLNSYFNTRTNQYNHINIKYDKYLKIMQSRLDEIFIYKKKKHQQSIQKQIKKSQSQQQQQSFFRSQIYTYSLQHHEISSLDYCRKEILFQPEIKIDNFFIKTEILSLINRLTQVNKSMMARQKQNYRKVFNYLVIIIDNQIMLIDIYANILYSILSSNQRCMQQLRYDVQQSLIRIRTIFGRRSVFELKNKTITMVQLVTVFERLRRIQLKVKSQNNNSQSNNNGYTSKRKADTHNLRPVYKEYFMSIFQGRFYDIMDYGQQLFDLKKFKESIFVVQILCSMIAEFQIHFKKNFMQNSTKDQYPKDRFFNHIDPNIDNVTELKVKCHKILSKAYAKLSTPFSQNNKFIDQISRPKHQKRKYSYTLDIENKQKQINQIEKRSLIFRITTKIQIHYVTNRRRIMRRYNENTGYLNQQSEEQIQQIIKQEAQFKSNIIQEIANYCLFAIEQIGTKQHLQQFYYEMFLGILLYNTYIEDYADQMKSMNQPKQRNRSSSQVEILDNNSNSLNNKIKSQNKLQAKLNALIVTYKLSNRYIYLLKGHLQKIKNKMNRFYCSRLLSIFNYGNQNTKIFYQSFLQTHDQQTLINMIEGFYGGIQFDNMGIIQLQVLQQLYFARKKFQKVKIIVKIMNILKIKQLRYGTNCSNSPFNYINWPHVYSNQLISKINDRIPNQFQIMKEQIQVMIKSQTKITVQFEQFYLEQIRNQKQFDKFKTVPYLVQKIQSELLNKIKRYFQLFRTIFVKINLNRKEGIDILLILELFYNQLFINNFVSFQARKQFFFYYFRFLNEKISCQALNSIQTKTNLPYYEVILNFIDKNIQYSKFHCQYLIRSMDTVLKTKKNNLLINILVNIFQKKTYQNCWILTYIKNYNSIAPTRFQNGYLETPQQSKINCQHKIVYEELYKSIAAKISQKRCNEATQIPQLFLQLLLDQQQQKVCSRYNVKLRVDIDTPVYIKGLINSINVKLNQTKQKMPYPFDEALYIKRINFIKTKSLTGKSSPIQLHFTCGVLKDIENQEKMKEKNKNNNQKNSNQNSFQSINNYFNKIAVNNSSSSNNLTSLSSNQSNKMKTDKNISVSSSNTLPTTYQVTKQVILKYNFSSNICHRIQPSTANFYKSIKLLDQQITYGIINLSKYSLMIQKIQANFVQLKTFIHQSCDITQQAEEELKVKSVQFKNAISSLLYIKSQKKEPYQSIIVESKWYDQIKLMKKTENFPYNPNLFTTIFYRGLQKSQNISTWWNYFQNYTRTMAQWSYLCFVSKLGDRHTANMLITDTGKIIHIDFQYNFGYGLTLPCPQWVPFRLTDLLTAGMGSFREKGLFFAHFVNIAKKFDLNSEQIWKALAGFSPDQREIVEQTSQFKIWPNMRFQRCCYQMIQEALDDQLLRFMFAGWSAHQ